jgi:Reverse transcriptase (RNA-dependent DNA polymerase)
VSLGWDIQQIDVKTAFLYGLLPEDEVQYMQQPAEFKEPGKADWVWQLQHGLYGMKQSGRIWNQTLNTQMIDWGFTHLSCKSCIYYHKSDSGIIIAAIHVDDYLSITDSKGENEHFKNQMRKVWTISELGTA